MYCNWVVRKIKKHGWSDLLNPLNPEMGLKSPKTIKKSLDTPEGPVVGTPCSQCRGHGFDLWSGN